MCLCVYTCRSASEHLKMISTNTYLFGLKAREALLMPYSQSHAPCHKEKWAGQLSPVIPS